MRISNLSECERVLVRALAGPPESEIFQRAREAMAAQAEHFDGLGIVTALQELAGRGDAESVTEPLDVLRQPGARAMVAQLLMREGEPVTAAELESALATLEYHFTERRLRQVLSAIADADRKTDLAGATRLAMERMELDRRLRELDRRVRELLGQA